MDVASPANVVYKGIKNPRKVPQYLLGKLDKTRIMEYEWAYRTWLISRGCTGSSKRPKLSDYDKLCELKTLQTEKEYETAIEEVRSLGLHPHPNPPKNWDALSALKVILSSTESDSRILDAGGAVYSPLIEWLWVYGYDHLYVQNIDFENDFQRGDIYYQDNDFTDTGFQSNSLDVITCLSVIEHGVPIRDAFEEFYRTLKPGGLLTISTDYWKEKIETGGKNTNYATTKQNWNIFNDEEIKDILKISEDIGFELPEKRQFAVEDRTLKWKGESYTFLYLELRK